MSVMNLILKYYNTEFGSDRITTIIDTHLGRKKDGQSTACVSEPGGNEALSARCEEK